MVGVLGVAVFCLYLLYNCILIENRAPSIFYSFLSPLKLTASQSSELRLRYGRLKFAGSHYSFIVHYIIWGGLCGLEGTGVADLVEIRDSGILEHSLTFDGTYHWGGFAWI